MRYPRRVELELDRHLVARQWFATDNAGPSAPWRTEIWRAGRHRAPRELRRARLIVGALRERPLLGR